MVGVAEILEEKEIIFPELVALTVGLWIIDKRVWRAQRWQIVALMTLGAVAGVCIVRFSPLPHPANMALAFALAAVCLLAARSSLIPLVSACMLPVLLYTEHWVYPVTVLVMSLILVGTQQMMEKKGLRSKSVYEPALKATERGVLKWFSLLVVVFLFSLLAYYSGWTFLVIPPLVVAFVEMSTSKAGFRNRPAQVFLLMIIGVGIGSAFQYFGYYQLGLPQTVVALLIALCLFGVFEWTGKYFAPAGALAFIPMIVPPETLPALPWQSALGAAVFIVVAMIAYLKCYHWSRAQFIYSVTPSLLRPHIHKKKR
jgi:hypothetical protein